MRWPARLSPLTPPPRGEAAALERVTLLADIVGGGAALNALGNVYVFAGRLTPSEAEWFGSDTA